MRTPRQIAFRARQELVNLCLTALPPSPRIGGDFVPGLRLPEGGCCEEDVIAQADQIRGHRFPIFGRVVDTGADIRWRRDYLRRIETGLDYFRRVRFLDAERTGDHKVIWELNRHQHLIVLAKAYRVKGDARDRDEIWAQLKSWMDANPFHRGINWASALEVAFRALSWIWVDQLIGCEMPSSLRGRWLHMLYLHGCHLANNFSFYFSPNTHLLGEALVLHALGLYFAGLPRAGRWVRTGARVMREQMDRQVRGDGSSFEQSTYYHVYALDMFTLHAALAHPDAEYRMKLDRMADFLTAITGPSERLPLLGDDDGGRVPLGPLRRTAARAENRRSRLFPDAGLAVMTCGNVHAIVDAGPFGALSAGHSHSDTLSIVLRVGDCEILSDPGTYTYTGEPKLRDWFRSSAAHNTIRIDGRDQAEATGPFCWIGRPEVEIIQWETARDRDLLEAECRYNGFTHRRRVEFQKPGVFLITDDVSGPPGLHEIEQFWHLGSCEARAKLILPADAEVGESLRSPVFGQKHLAPRIRVRRRAELPLRLEARIELNR